MIAFALTLNFKLFFAITAASILWFWLSFWILQKSKPHGDIFMSSGGRVTISGQNNSARGAALFSPARKGWESKQKNGSPRGAALKLGVPHLSRALRKVGFEDVCATCHRLGIVIRRKASQRCKSTWNLPTQAKTGLEWATGPARCVLVKGCRTARCRARS
jgi:hypothetical protein